MLSQHLRVSQGVLQHQNRFGAVLHHGSHLCFTLNKLLVREMRKTHPSGHVESILQKSVLGQGRDVALRFTVERSFWSAVTPNPALVFKTLKGIYTSCLQPRVSEDVPLCHLIFTYVLLTLIASSSKYRHTF